MAAILLIAGLQSDAKSIKKLGSEDFHHALGPVVELWPHVLSSKAFELRWGYPESVPDSVKTCENKPCRQVFDRFSARPRLMETWQPWLPPAPLVLALCLGPLGVRACTDRLGRVSLVGGGVEAPELQARKRRSRFESFKGCLPYWSFVNECICVFYALLAVLSSDSLSAQEFHTSATLILGLDVLLYLLYAYSSIDSMRRDTCIAFALSFVCITFAVPSGFEKCQMLGRLVLLLLVPERDTFFKLQVLMVPVNVWVDCMKTSDADEMKLINMILSELLGHVGIFLILRSLSSPKSNLLNSLDSRNDSNVGKNRA